MAKDITAAELRAMDRAVEWLQDHGGSGVLNKFARVLAGGEVADRIACETWMRCVFSGRLVVDRETNRLYTPAAFAERERQAEAKTRALIYGSGCQ